MVYAIWARCKVCHENVATRLVKEATPTEIQIALNEFVPACRNHAHNDFTLEVTGGKTWPEVSRAINSHIRNLKQKK